MTRITPAYLEEDLAQIQRYFPGATAVALRTPFDLHDRPRRQRGVQASRRTIRKTPALKDRRARMSARGNVGVTPTQQTSGAVFHAYITTLSSIF